MPQNTINFRRLRRQIIFSKYIFWGKNLLENYNALKISKNFTVSVGETPPRNVGFNKSKTVRVVPPARVHNSTMGKSREINFFDHFSITWAAKRRRLHRLRLKTSRACPSGGYLGTHQF